MTAVLHVTRVAWPHIGGMEAAVHELARAQAALGWSVTVMAGRRDGAEGRVHDGVRYETKPLRGPRRYPWVAGAGRAARRFDVVHVHGLDANADWLARARLLHRTPVGISTHGGFLHTGQYRRLKQLWLRTVTRGTLRAADAVWFTSVADQRALSAAGVPGEVIGNAVAVEPLLARTRKPEVGRWLVPGRVDVHKGIDDLLDALAGLASSRLPATLRVVGPCRDPALLASLRRKAGRAGLAHRVEFVGAVDREAWLHELQAAEWVLFPSRHEGFGIAVVEAMAMGAGVVCSDISAFRELVEPGLTGLIVPMRDRQAAAAVLKDLLGRDTQAMGEAARRAARAHRPEVVVSRYVDAYRRLGVRC